MTVSMVQVLEAAIMSESPFSIAFSPGVFIKSSGWLFFIYSFFLFKFFWGVNFFEGTNYT